MRLFASIFFTVWTLYVCALQDYSKLDSAYIHEIERINEAIKQGQQNNNLTAMADGYYDRALCNFYTPLKSQDVIGDLIESAKIYKYLKNNAGFFRTRLALAEFYTLQEIYLNEALKLTEEAYEFFLSARDQRMQIKATTQLGKIHQKRLDYDRALDQVDKGLQASIALEDRELELENRLLITELFGNLGNVEKVVEQGSYLIGLEENFGLEGYAGKANYLIGKYLSMDGQYDEAIPYLLKAKEQVNNVSELAHDNYSLLAELFNITGDHVKAYDHLKNAKEIRTSLYNQEKYALSNQIAVKYQTYEKEKAMRALEEDYQLTEFRLTQRTRLFIILMALLVLTAAAIFNYYRLQKHKLRTERLISQQKEEIARQKIYELESELKIKNLEAMVHGEEAERTRIATDLHDSLGGMLSTLKLQYDALQIDHEDLGDDQDYHKIMRLIDEACKDVRDIARNLKPASLEKMGLSAALKDLVNRYSSKIGGSEISLTVSDVNHLLDEESQLHVYRIIQELLNNALKHSEAKEIDVQVHKNEETLLIKVEDDGKGFVEDEVVKGLGLGNLESRVNVLRGEMDIDSTPAKGTSIFVHIPLNSETVVPV